MERIYEEGSSADKNESRESFAALREEVSAGGVPAAEPDASMSAGCRVNAWVKQGILVGFRCGDLVDVSVENGGWFFGDKDTLPLKKMSTAMGVRVVPGGSSIR